MEADQSMKADEQEKEIIIDSKKSQSSSYPPPYPCVIISHGKRRRNTILYDLSKHTYCKLGDSVIPKMEDKVIYRCGLGGWLVLGGKDCNEDQYFLLNLLSQEKIQLPCPHMNCSFCLLTASPSESNCYIVFINVGSEHHKTMFKFCHPKDEEYSLYMFDGLVEGVTIFGGKIYCFIWHSFSFVILDFVGTTTTLQSSPLVVIRGVPPLFLVPKSFSQIYVVEDSDSKEMLVVYKYRIICWDVGFRVFKFDFSSRDLVEVIRLGDKAIFAGESNSVCCCATAEYQIKPNSIYYTEPGETALYRYDLQERSTTPYSPLTLANKPYPLFNWVFLPTQIN